MGGVRCVVLALLVLFGTGCKKLFRGKFVVDDPKVMASVVKPEGKQRAYKVKVDVQTVPEAEVRATLDGSRRSSETVKASKKGEATLELDWEGSEAEAQVNVSIEKKEPDRLGLFRGDRTHGSSSARISRPGERLGATLAAPGAAAPFSFKADFMKAWCLGGEITCSVELQMAPPGLKVSAPVGTKVSWAGKTFVTKGASDTFALPASDVDKLTEHAFDPSYKQKTTATLTFPSGESGKADFTFSGVWLQSTYLARLDDAKKGPVSMPNDDAAPPRARALYVSAGTKSVTIGKPTKFSDFDIVGFRESKTRERTCGPYRGAKTGKSSTFELHMYDEIITIHDRRTGRVKAKRTFTAPAQACPRSFMSSSLASSGSWPDDKVIDTWLKSLVQSP